MARLYISKNNLGLGLLSCRDEYSKELLRVLLKYKWESNTDINVLIEATNTMTDGIWNRLIKSIRKKVSQKDSERPQVKTEDNDNE